MDTAENQQRILEIRERDIEKLLERRDNLSYDDLFSEFMNVAFGLVDAGITPPVITALIEAVASRMKIELEGVVDLGRIKRNVEKQESKNAIAHELEGSLETDLGVWITKSQQLLEEKVASGKIILTSTEQAAMIRNALSFVAEDLIAEFDKALRGISPTIED